MSSTALGLVRLIYSALRSTHEEIPVVEAPRRWHANPRVLCLAFAAALGCGSSERSPAAGFSGSSSAGAGGVPADGGAGGQGGIAGSSGAGTTPSNAGSDSGPTQLDAGDAGDADSVEDGTDPTDAASDAGGGDDGPEVWSCDGNYAFGAGSTLAFLEPTPADLASALTTINGATHAISLVLHLNEGTLLGALSATTEGDNGKQLFLPDHVPPFAPAVAAFGSPPGVTSVDPQQNATLHFVDEAGPLDIQLEHIVWRATQGSSCADMTVSMQAVIPTSELSVVVHLPAGEQTIGELVSASSSGSPTPIGGSDPPALPVEIAATFVGVPLDFDFDTL